MTVRVEFFGIPRQRAGVQTLELFFDSDAPRSLEEVLRETGRRLPEFASSCLEENELRSGYIACLSGRTFTCEPTATVAAGETVMILSADAGG